jgi:radical SAM superfamily enzyme YgiQ (UPF0313 family)
VELAYFNVLTPLPGTALFDRYNAAGRIFDRDWAKYDGKHVVYTPSRMTPEQLQEGFYWANHHFYSLPCIWRRLSGTSQRFVPRLIMNREFRKLVKRSCPKGTLSLLASVLKTLQAKLPTLQAASLIPNALHVRKETPGQDTTAEDRWLSIKAKRHDQYAAVLVDLEGTLDQSNMQELVKRIKDAARRARLDIIINFEHLKQATPEALLALTDGELWQAVVPYAKIRYRKFKAAFAASLADLSSHRLNLWGEDPLDGAVLPPPEG